MSLSRSLTRRLQKDNEQSVYIPRATTASLDDLLAHAQRLGRVEMGGTFHPNGAEIKVYLGEDWLYVRSRKLPTIKDNLAECIHRAELYKRFHTSI